VAVVADPPQFSVAAQPRVGAGPWLRAAGHSMRWSPRGNAVQAQFGGRPSGPLVWVPAAGRTAGDGRVGETEAHEALAQAGGHEIHGG